MPKIPASKPYRIGRSRTGLGLFATKPIKKGDKIIRYFGPMLDCSNKKHERSRTSTCSRSTAAGRSTARSARNIARYINHACRPNAESDVSKRKRGS